MFDCASNTLGKGVLIGGCVLCVKDCVLCICKYSSLVMFVVCRQLNGNHGEWTNGDDMPDPIEDSRFFAFQEVVFDFTMRELILLRSMMANHHLTMEEVITFHSECRYVHPPFDIIVGEYWVYASRLARFRREVPTENCIMLFRLYSSPLIHSALNGSHGEWTNSDDVFSQRVMKNARFLASKSEYWDMMTRAAQDELVNKYARVLQAKDLNSQIEWLPEERVKYLYLAQEYFAARNEPANPAQIRNHALVTFQNDIISETFGFADPNPFSVLDEKPSQHPVHNHNKVVDVDGRGDGTGGDGDKPPLPAPAVAAPEPPSAPKLPPIEGDGYVEEKESDESKPPKPETPPAEPP